MELAEQIAKYKELRSELQAFHFASYVIGWDSETEAPSGCFEERSKYEGILSSLEMKISRSEEYVGLIKSLYEQRDSLDELLKVEIKKEYKNLMNELKVPEKEMIDYSILMAKSAHIWANAKVNNDYKSFAPILNEVIGFNKRYAKYVETPELKGYDTLLDQFEEGMTKEKYDAFFALLKKEIVPLVHQINDLHLEVPAWAKQKFPIEKQKEFSEYIMDIMCFDRTRGLMKESEHPFTSGFTNTDVRVTNHYYEDLVLSSVFSAVHELGHATYEQQNDSKLNGTNLSGGTTMAMHESQSRFYENIVARSYPFWKRHYSKLQSIFYDQLKDVTLDEFYQYANFVECSLVRTEADELTYPLHIMVRYEMEKMMTEQDVDVNELPQIWNKLYKEYLGIDVPSDKEGILQDVHWSSGLFGYFPTYALGSAYGAQLLHQMKKEMNIDEVFGAPTTKPINDWLKEKVHKFGGLKTPDEILLAATGEHFNPQYYVDYLKEKFTKIYHLK